MKVGVHTAEGMGTNKKVAKRNAAENMLELLGFKIPQPQPPKPALKTEEKVRVFKNRLLFNTTAKVELKQRQGSISVVNSCLLP